MKIKWYNFNFSMKKGNIEKYKPFLDYISKNYYPESLSIAQMLWYEHMKSVPIPIIEFKAPCVDALDIIDDFIKMCGKQFMVGGASPFKWIYKDPVLTATKLVRIYKRHHELEETRKKEGWKK